ncbi:MAG: polysaccharide deacetylase family protein [Flavobacteriales bacterium]|jgi:peptidoglycan/xylan/chitin deacetylase (PgdA/CDA1 family)|nr:polysaccharide deacetylase family protein [Flavobacteriales bacterium]
MKQIARALDHWSSELYAERYIRTAPYIVSVYLHKLYTSKAEFTPLNGSVNEGVTIAEFERCIAYYRERNFTFINANDLHGNALDRTKKHVQISFDDGYFNNLKALPVLERHGAKATFYITTEPNRNPRYFWWDVLSRERAKEAKQTKAERIAEEIIYYGLTWEEQYARLKDEFGEDTLYGDNEMMRPMTREELVKFSEHPSVTIGNHTTKHQNLELLGDVEALAVIQEASRYLEDAIGKEIRSIAYPYGFHSERIKRIARNAGMLVGQSVLRGVDTVKDMDCMAVKRNQLSGAFSIEDQSRQLHVNYSIFHRLKTRLT